MTSSGPVPVLFDASSPTDPAQPGKFMVLAMQCPDTQSVLAYMHAMRFPDLLVYEILARYPEYRRNVWFDMSATATLFAGSPFAERLAWVSRKIGVDRLLWASDYPMDDPREALDAVRTGYDFDDEELRSICHDNAVAVYGLG